MRSHDCDYFIFVYETHTLSYLMKEAEASITFFLMIRISPNTLKQTC